MDLKSAYTQISERSLTSADASIASGIQESATFFAYHAFESLGGALCSSVGEVYSKGHSRKINQFVAASRRGKLRVRISHDVAYVGMVLSSFRNKSLYPEELASGAVELPSDFITLSNAKDIVKRVKGVTRKVVREL